MSILIVCDGFKIGGIERLALDQAYYLRSKSFKCQILVLSKKPKKNEHIFRHDESKTFNSLNVQFRFIPGSRYKQYKKIKVLIRSNKYRLVICHSLRASVLFWSIRFFSRLDFKITSTLHQLPSLSAPLQRFRRLIYSQFTDRLFFFSASALYDWNFRRKRNIFLNFITYFKKASVCRNGVYLSRLPAKQKELVSQNSKVTRLVFIGRITAWKGLDTFFKIANHPKLTRLQILVVVPSFPDEYLTDITKDLDSRIKFVIGKSISKVKFNLGDLLVYPANYGPKSLFTEGVSINVLEMACIGVPSIISRNGNLTWPELSAKKVLYEVDWDNLDAIANLIIKDIEIPSPSTIQYCRDIINISHNIQQHLEVGCITR